MIVFSHKINKTKGGTQIMRKNEKRTIILQTIWKRKAGMRAGLAVLSLAFALTLSGKSVLAASYSGDYRYWSQGGSDYNGMREVGCLITAQAKLLYESNVNRSDSFNPDSWYNWLLQNGGIASSTDLNMRDHNAPVYYAKSAGKNLEYLGYWKADDDQLWYNINAGYYTIVHVGGTNTGGSHFVLIDNELSKQKGALYCYDSFSDRGSVGQQLLSRYSIHKGGHVYKGNNAVHTHSYASSVTAQPTCTQPGVKTYNCSCGSSYTEPIQAKGHNYAKQIIAPTLEKQGYTLYTCSICNDSYKDSYTDVPKESSDGWIYCDMLPDGITAENYMIQYKNYYEKIQQSSPGNGWTDAGQIKDEWQNSGDPYTSTEDLQTSDSRVLIRSVYYHFCGGSAGNEGNYEQTGKFVHYDEIPASSVTARYLGTDNGHPYYFIDWIDGGGRVWCKSGVSCDSSYGTHGNRCCAWYKMNTYQNRVKVVQNKFSKTSDWTDKKDENAASVKIRFRILDKSAGANETGESGSPTEPVGTTGTTDSTGTNGANKPADSTESTGTDELADSTEPTGTDESTEPTEPAEPNESAEGEGSQNKTESDITIEYILSRLKEMLYELFSLLLKK